MFDLELPEIQVERGKITYLIGPNGSGKSLYFSALEEEYDAISDFSVLLVRQSPDDNIANSLTVVENLSLWLRSEKFVDYFLPTRRLALSIQSWEDRFPTLRGVWTQAASTLSGGQKQIVAIISRLLSGPTLLLLDEAFSSVDESVLPNINKYVSEYVAENNCACVVISHDISRIALSSDRILLLSNGRLVSNFSRADFPGENGAALMKQTILSAWNHPD